MRKLYILFFIILYFSAASLGQTTVNLPAIADNTIYDDFTTNSNGAGPNFTAGKNGVGSTRRALIRFNVASSIPIGSVITSVSLRLTLNKTKFGTDNVSLYKLNSDWGEGTSNAGDPDGQGVSATINDATWTCKFSDGVGGCNSSWSTAGGDIVAAPSATTSVPSVLGNYTWSSSQMVADVQLWVNTPSTDFGWLIQSNETTIRTVNRFDSRTGTTPPELTVTYSPPVPVTLSFFKVRETNAGVLLNWQTQQEINNAYFLIEHSTDAINFSSIGKVNGKGTTATVSNYQFTHIGIATGNHYYRLAQTDIGGTVKYSSVVQINTKNKSFSFQITPNPVASKIQLQGCAFAPGTQYSIITAVGKVLLSGIIKNNFIDVSSLQKSSYFIRLIMPDGKTTVSNFVKQ